MISNVDDHLRNHSFLWLDRTGMVFVPSLRSQSRADRNEGAHSKATNISLDEGTCSVDLLEEAAEYFVWD